MTQKRWSNTLKYSWKRFILMVLSFVISSALVYLGYLGTQFYNAWKKIHVVDETVYQDMKVQKRDSDKKKDEALVFLLLGSIILV